MKSFFSLLLVVLLLGGLGSCNIPNTEKLKNLETKVEGLYSIPVTKFSYNTNTLFDDYFKYDLAVFKFIKQASDYNQDFSENEQKEIILGDKPVQFSIKNNSRVDPTEITFLSGKVKIKMEYISSVDSKVEFIMNDLKDTSGNSLRISVPLSVSETEAIVEKETSILGYKLTPTAIVNPKTGLREGRTLTARRKITAMILGSTKQINVNVKTTELSIEDPRVEYLRGNFGSHKETLPKQVLSFVNVFSKSPSGLSFGSSGHKLVMDFVNPFSVPVYVKFQKIEAFYADGTSKIFNFYLSSLSTSVTFRNTVILDPAVEESDGTLSFVTKTFVFDKQNSNIESLFSGALGNFGYISLESSVEINPSLTSPNKLPGVLSGKVDLSISLKTEIPVVTEIKKLN